MAYKEVLNNLLQQDEEKTVKEFLEFKSGQEKSILKEERERIVKLVKSFNKKLYKIINSGNPITWRLINDSIDNLIDKIISQKENND
jgi:predicted Zn-ribbon and HTH transcriptional regulator